MSFMILGIGFALLPLLLRPARKLRLGLLLFCGILMLTVFHGWYQAHAALADGILFAGVGVAIPSWVVAPAPLGAAGGYAVRVVCRQGLRRASSPGQTGGRIRRQRQGRGGEGVEDAIYAMRKFMGISFLEQDVPDAAIRLHFRHPLEDNGIGKLFFDAINRRPAAQGFRQRH